MIGYSLSSAARVRLSIYDMRGHHVVTLVNAVQSAGYRNVRWDGCDSRGKALSGEFYVYRLDIDEHTLVRRMKKRFVLYNRRFSFVAPRRI